jgi:hypothetical protein
MSVELIFRSVKKTTNIKNYALRFLVFFSSNCENYEKKKQQQHGHINILIHLLDLLNQHTEHWVSMSYTLASHTVFFYPLCLFCLICSCELPAPPSLARAHSELLSRPLWHLLLQALGCFCSPLLKSVFFFTSDFSLLLLFLPLFSLSV